MEHPPKQGLKHLERAKRDEILSRVLMEHPPKQGLKLYYIQNRYTIQVGVLMEHPPKQGLKLKPAILYFVPELSFNGTSTKTRIETLDALNAQSVLRKVLMEHPPKQGLKLCNIKRREKWLKQVLMEHPPKQGLKQPAQKIIELIQSGFNGTSTKTRIETLGLEWCSLLITGVLMEHPPKQGLKPYSLLLYSSPKVLF